MRWCWVVGGALAVTTGADAQTKAAAKQCIEILNAQTPDSEVVQLSIIVSAFDTVRQLSPSYAALLGDEIRQVITIPQPLSLDTYHEAALSKGASPTLRTAYRATLHRNGHLSNAHRVGGTRVQAFDDAMLKALITLDTSRSPPPAESADFGPPDSIDVHILVTPDVVSPATTATKLPHVPRDAITPLVRIRLPVYAMKSQAAPHVGQSAPRYPPDLRAKGVDGETRFEFVVDASGQVEASSIQILYATASQFVEAVLDVLPNLKFFPMVIGGCPVASLVQMPFTFIAR